MGATPLRLSASADFRAVIRHVHVMSLFDRLGLALTINIPYGTVSRILTMLCNEGYIEKVFHLWDKKKIYEKKGYSKALPEANHDMRVNGRVNWSYTDKRVVHQQLYRATEKWREEFIPRWNHFLEKGEDTWQVYSQRTASSSRKKGTPKTKRRSAQRGKTHKGGSQSSSAQGSSSVTVTVTTTTSASTRSKKRKIK